MGRFTALFDFDGVVVDTESQYTIFWSGMGQKYLGVEDFGLTIKGQTLRQIFDRYFNGMEDVQAAIVPMLDKFEAEMSYGYIPGVEDFIHKLKKAGIPMAIVTSSDSKKMEKAFKAHPELPELFDAILMSEDFTRSKPDPECFLKGMERLGGTPGDTVVFEDSFHGLRAGRASGAFVTGLTTTNPEQAVAPLCDLVIEDFRGLDPEHLAELVAKGGRKMSES